MAWDRDAVGMGSGWIGEKARTIVPESATAELDLRLVVLDVLDAFRRLGGHGVRRRRSLCNLLTLVCGNLCPAGVSYFGRM